MMREEHVQEEWYEEEGIENIEKKKALWVKGCPS